jgi:predicted nucleic acid-binding protein
VRILLDTNVVARLAEPAHPQHASAQSAIRKMLLAKDELVVVPQIVYEFWVVATRPMSQNGLGLELPAARSEIAKIEAMFVLLDDTAGLYSEWLELVIRHDVKGKLAHDARLVAAMKVHGVTEMITFNTGDFARYSGIRVRSPVEVTA